MPALLDAALPAAKRVIHPNAPTSNFKRFQQISLCFSEIPQYFYFTASTCVNLSLVSSVCVCVDGLQGCVSYNYVKSKTLID